VLLPLAVAGLLLLMHGGALAYKTLVLGRRRDLRRHSHVLVAALLSLAYYLYLYETQTLLAVFDCAPTTPPDGYEYLRVVFERCGAPGGTQRTLLPYAAVGLVVYTAGYPIGALLHLLRHRELVMEDQLLRAKGVGEDRLTNPHAYDFRKRFGRMYYQFAPDVAPFWVVVIVLRKLLVVLGIVLLNHNPAFQLAAVLLVLLAALGLHLSVAPYMSPSRWEGVLEAHAAAAFSSATHARLRASIAGIESRGRKRTHRNLLDFNGRVDRRALLGLLATWLFDPNTLEGALIFIAAVVCLLGIVLESQALQSSYYGSTVEGVSGAIIGLVVLGILYYVAVVITELAVLASARQREAALLRNRRASKTLGGKEPAASPGGGRSLRRSLSGGFSDVPSKRGLAAGGGGGGGGGGARELNTGQLELALNPLAVAANSGVGGARTSVTAESAGALDPAVRGALDAVRAFRTAPPPLELWRVIAGSYEDLAAQSAAMAAALEKTRASAEEQAAERGAAAGGAHHLAARSVTKATFDPVARPVDDGGLYGPSAAALQQYGMGGGSSRTRIALAAYAPSSARRL
jgi:hypothetical protein